MRPFLCVVPLLLSVAAGPLALPAKADPPPGTPPSRPRRILYNLDGDSCLTTLPGGHPPVRPGASPKPRLLEAPDMRHLVTELTGSGSQVDTLLVCINAQVLYFPSPAGTLRGTLSTAEERKAWSDHESRRFATIERFHAAGQDPYALILAEARKAGREAWLSFRVNDDHGNDFLRTRFRAEHPECRLGAGALDFGHDSVRAYILQLIEAAVTRYDADGLELDFNRFPRFFSGGSAEGRVAAMTSLVGRVHERLGAEATLRGRRYGLAVRVPSNFGTAPPTPESALALGCDVADWAKRGWLDFVTVSEFLYEREDLPIAVWKSRLAPLPVYGGIECTAGGTPDQYLTAAAYRRAARRRWSDGADGIYLFNMFTTREHGAEAWEPPFEVLGQLGAVATLEAAEAASSDLFVPSPVTAPGSFTKGVEGPACGPDGALYAVNFAREGSIARISPNGRALLWLDLPEGSTGNGLRFDRQGALLVADYTGHNLLRIDPRTREVTVAAHDAALHQPNDIAVAPDGTVYASDPSWGQSTGQLWRIGPGGAWERLADALGTTNGIEVSPDGRTLYVNESVQRGVWAWDIQADGRLANRRLVRQFADFGFDGMRCDIDGNLYITRHGKGTVVKMAPDGTVLREITLPGSLPTNICFGGPDGRTAFVTEAEHQWIVQFRVDRPGREWRGAQDR